MHKLIDNVDSTGTRQARRSPSFEISILASLAPSFSILMIARVI